MTAIPNQPSGQSDEPQGELPELLYRLLAHSNSVPQATDAVLDLALAIGAGQAALHLESGSGPRLVRQRNVDPARELDLEALATRARATGQIVEIDRRDGVAFSLPLAVEGDPVGVLSVHVALPGPAGTFDPDQARQTLIGAAPTIAIALRHAALLETAQQRERDQAMLTAATRRFNSTLELGTILNDVARSAAQEIGDFGAVLLVNPGKPELTVAATFDRNPAAAALRGAVLAAHPARADSGAFAEVIRDRKIATLVTPNPAEGEDERQAVSCLAVPIFYRGEALGTLVLGSNVEDPGRQRLSDRERSLAASLADSAAPAIYHGGLFRSISREESFLRSVLDNLPEAVLIIEVDGTGRAWISILNLTAQDLFGERLQAGAPYRALLAKDFIQTPDGNPLDPVDNLFSFALAGEIVTGVELLVSTELGRRTMLASANGIVGRNDEVVAVVAIMQDITQRHELEQEKDAFLAVAAHELRSPLTNLRGQLQLVERQSNDLPANLRRRITSANQAAEKLSDLTVRLLDVSRIGLGRLVLEREPVDLIALIRDLAARMAPRLESLHLMLHLPDEPVDGSWDRQRLEEVLSNLIDNAARYSPKTGTIWIDITEGTQEVETPGYGVGELSLAIIRVRDEGPGISPEALPHLFERFGGNRGGQQSPRSPQADGLGLGLFICRSIVEAHRGTINVDSQPGQGTTFVVTLPRLPGA